MHPSPSFRRARTACIAVALVAALQLVPVASPAQAAVRPTAVLAASVSKPVVDAGGTVLLTGSMTVAGRPAAGVLVRVQKRVHGTAKWRPLTTARTDAAGRVTLQTPDLLRSHDFRLVAAGNAASAPVSVTAQQQVAVTDVSDFHPVAGDAVTVSASSLPGLSDRRASLQLLTPAGWRSVASSRVPRTGAVELTVRSMQSGERDYRVVVSGPAGIADAVSEVQVFEVAGWYRLADLAPLGSTSFASGPKRLGGTVYRDAVSVPLAQGTSAYTEYSLDYRCSTLRTTLGVADDSAEGSVTRFLAKVDDARPVNADVVQGQPQAVEADVSGGDVLRLTDFAVNGDSTGAWGDAEVLCVGAP